MWQELNVKGKGVGKITGEKPCKRLHSSSKEATLQKNKRAKLQSERTLEKGMHRLSRKERSKSRKSSSLKTVTQQKGTQNAHEHTRTKRKQSSSENVTPQQAKPQKGRTKQNQKVKQAKLQTRLPKEEPCKQSSKLKPRKHTSCKRNGTCVLPKTKNRTATRK